MLHKTLNLLGPLFQFERFNAHCDIPCRIYDPATAIIAALSVIRVIDIMNEIESQDDPSSLSSINTLIRCVQRKEEEAERLKHEVRVIWGDYFKEPQFQSHPDIHELTHNIMLKASVCKQGSKHEDAENLLELVNQFAEIFWATKDIKTVRIVAPYPPSLPVVYPQI